MSKSLTLPDSYSPENFAEGILYYGVGMYESRAIYDAWIVYNILIHPEYKKSMRDLDGLIGKVWETPEIKKAFGVIKQKPQIKTVRNRLSAFRKNAMPFIEAHGFQEGVKMAMAEHAGNLLRSGDESSPKRGTADGCRHCTKHNCPKE